MGYIGYAKLPHMFFLICYLCRPSGVLRLDVIVRLNLMLEVEAMTCHVYAHIAFVGT